MLMKIAIVTPTWNRPEFLRQTHRYMRAQRLAQAQIRWFVLDDSDFPISDDWTQSMQVAYRWLDAKITLGRKRNMLNDAARAWGADFICAMDDDDWYGPDYVADMVGLLSGPHDMAGSGPHYYCHIASGRIVKVPAVRPDSTCNALLCYRASVLQTARYDDNRTFAEEAAFLAGHRVAQHPDIARVHLATIHGNNTVSKRNYLLNPAYQTPLTLADFPMEEADRQFYEARRLNRTPPPVAPAPTG
jgi:hypothetical protein